MVPRISPVIEEEPLLTESIPITRATTVAGRRFVWQEMGRGAPVVLLHSGGLSGRQWRRLAETLSSDFRVIVPDFFGYGASEPWPAGEPFHFQQDVDAARQILAQLDGPVDLVGHSYGGLIALKLLLENPSGVGRLALFEPVAFGVLSESDDEDAVEVFRAVRMAYQPSTPGGVDEVWLQSFVEWWNGKGAWKALGDDVKEAFRRSSWKLYQEVQSLAADRTPLDAYRGLPNATLFLGSQYSPLPERRVIERLAGAMPAASLRIFEGAGHMAPLTHAAMVNAAIVRHLTDRGESA